MEEFASPSKSRDADIRRPSTELALAVLQRQRLLLVRQTVSRVISRLYCIGVSIASISGLLPVTQGSGSGPVRVRMTLVFMSLIVLGYWALDEYLVFRAVQSIADAL